ncbi:AtuA-related protein [Enterovirga sp. CN4-39]|uniref:AtuA-related protein n=1 Tax=Enterovirga sp. CN4-39 TaxID=3400910 RepID=UPI003C0358F9
MRVGDIACGRSGDKASTLDLTLVARDEAAYRLLERTLTAERAQAEIAKAVPGTLRRYELPKLLALKYVIDGALPGGVYATLHAGLHWQKAATYVLLDMEIEPEQAGS